LFGFIFGGAPPGAAEDALVFGTTNTIAVVQNHLNARQVQRMGASNHSR
jgi:hypothetical protein